MRGDDSLPASGREAHAPRGDPGEPLDLCLSGVFIVCRALQMAVRVPYLRGFPKRFPAWRSSYFSDPLPHAWHDFDK